MNPHPLLPNYLVVAKQVQHILVQWEPCFPTITNGVFIHTKYVLLYAVDIRPEQELLCIGLVVPTSALTLVPYQVYTAHAAEQESTFFSLLALNTLLGIDCCWQWSGGTGLGADTELEPAGIILWI